MSSMDYFGDFPFKGLPSPADTPYETPDFIRSKRSSRTTMGSSREQSASPPPLPPDALDLKNKQNDNRYGAMDPRRFTPTLHASLVSEILNLRRELDSKNHLVENLEQSLSTAKAENDAVNAQLSSNAKEVREAKLQVQQMEKGTYDVVEGLAKERDAALVSADELKAKVEASQKAIRRQDEDAERTQGIWESEKERWDNERRQLERRVHVTESRLRTVVEEMGAQLAAAESRVVHVEDADDSAFKDSGIGNESDTASVASVTPVKHRRNKSSLSSRRSVRMSTMSRNTATPDPHGKPNGYSLADELGIDEEDEYDMDEFEHQDEELEYNESLRRTMESRQSSIVGGDADSKAKRVLGLTNDVETPSWSLHLRDRPKSSVESAPMSEPPRKASVDQVVQAQPSVEPQNKPLPRVLYVDTGYQPSPPPSPPRVREAEDERPVVPEIKEPKPAGREGNSARETGVTSPSPVVLPGSTTSPISPPETPVVDGKSWPAGKRMSFPRPDYASSSTQTEIEEAQDPKGHTPKRDSLSPPAFVPSIAIHPPSSRPSSPRPYVLPPGTKNASTQVSLPWTSRDAAVQTEEIRVDRRPIKLPQHLLPKNLLPSPTFEEPPPPKPASRKATGGTAKIFTNGIPPAPSLPSPPLRSPVDTSPEMSRNTSQKDLQSMPLRALPLPRPVLAPLGQSQGPLNRSAQYGVTKAGQRSSQLLDMDRDSDSDGEDFISDIDTNGLESSLSALSRPPVGRFGLSHPPRAVPEDKEISPERRPGTAESYGAAPAPSVASSRSHSRQASHRELSKAHGKRPAHKDHRSRSPSFGSVISSAYSTQSAAPPFPIPTRSSSRVVPNSHSEGSTSPVPYHTDVFGNRAYHRHQKGQPSRNGSLRKVQSAAVIRNAGRKGSPQKARRRMRRSPDLTPVQSMAFDSPMPTDFPIPELPTPLQTTAPYDFVKGSMDIGGAPTTVASTPRVSEETNLVDAIASTMVGEWMWKYIRKRKSFGVQEDFPVAEDGSVNTASHGTRHKRWVWLSPYERTIMWDSKQPASGTALLGKKGRKLAISSVVEVEDRTPLPKNPELHTAYDRSILILTPARALKFTATNAERHLLWMKALSFLAESGNLPSQIPPMPSLPRPPQIPLDAAPTAKRHHSPSFGRATVRDSIRLAKGKRPPLPPTTLTHPATTRDAAMLALEGSSPRDDSADFPSVPRLYITTSRHQRKRSNTSPRLPAPLSTFRNFSSSAVPTTTSTALNPPTASTDRSSSYRPSASSKGSRPTSTSLASPDRPNFFEAVGTVRMEAFVDPNVRNGVLYVPAPPPPSGGNLPGQMNGVLGNGAVLGVGGRRRRGDSNLSQATTDKRRAGYVFDENGFDPFKNF